MRVFDIREAADTLQPGHTFKLVDDYDRDFEYRDRNVEAILEQSGYTEANMFNPLKSLEQFIEFYTGGTMTTQYENGAWYLVHESDVKSLEGVYSNHAGR